MCKCEVILERLSNTLGFLRFSDGTVSTCVSVPSHITQNVSDESPHAERLFVQTAPV